LGKDIKGKRAGRQEGKRARGQEGKKAGRQEGKQISYKAIKEKRRILSLLFSLNY